MKVLTGTQLLVEIQDQSSRRYQNNSQQPVVISEYQVTSDFKFDWTHLPSSIELVFQNCEFKSNVVFPRTTRIKRLAFEECIFETDLNIENLNQPLDLTGSVLRK